MSNAFDGFVPIHTIFYTLFHPTEGSKVRFQFPPNSLENGGLNFDTIKNYVIPKPQLCNKLLTFKCGNYRLVCYPVNVNAGYYARNSFNFDIVFVFDYDCATSPYEPAIARLGKMFKVLEEQSQILSKAEQDPVYFQLKASDSTNTDQNTEIASISVPEHTDIKVSGDNGEKYQEIIKDLSKGNKELIIEDLLMKLFLDLNNYSECLIPIDAGNSIDIKLFPVRTPPSATISIDDVPIAIVDLPSIIDVNWDPTMLKIVPYINGINSIFQIAACAKSNVELVQECIRHLVYYRCVVLSDIFQFSNIYAPTSEIHRFLTNPAMAKACQLFVQTDNPYSKQYFMPFEGRPPYMYPANKKNTSSSTVHTKRRDSNETGTESFSSTKDADKNLLSNSSTSSYLRTQHSETISVGTNEKSRKRMLPTKSCLFDLYRSLSQGKTVKEWYRQNFEVIRDNRIDVRKLITFGVTRRLIYRINSYPIVKNSETWDFLKTLSSGSKLAGKSDFNTNNVFSAADIKIDMENTDVTKEETKLEAADELLKNLYQKLSLKHDNSQSMSRFAHYFEEGAKSGPDSASRKSSSGSHQKVAFDFGLNKQMPPTNDSKQTTDVSLQSTEWKRKRKEELAILESLRNTETLDQMCTKLQKDRHDVEKILKDLGHYNIINS